ncbi:MAG: LysM peptidoglycan-binding domain-containing protein [Lachnospiraceae bacterium]|nr:LysM peptidoglycan-binding domain-containing protein [Lachnospiraceae bacterium]MCI9200786.1 LysM peptidoglycan-binding domain-containing protein [Lachnospiraceae bacterium]
MGLGLQSLKKAGAVILGVVFLTGLILPCREILAAEQYPFIYDATGLPEEPYLILTETVGEYTVHPGDSLWKIAEKQLGDGNFYPQLIAANPDVLTDPDLIYPQTRLHISRTGYIRRAEAARGGLQMGEYSFDMPYGGTVGTMQSGEAGGNLVLSQGAAGSSDWQIACLVQDRLAEAPEGDSDWQTYTQQITAYARAQYGGQVSDLHFEHYRMDDQGDAAGELYLYSYIWQISPDDYPELTCRVCAGFKLTDHLQAEFIGYTLDDYDIRGCIRYVTASFEEHFDAENAETFTVNNSNMCITPETDWPPEGMYNSFAYIDEFFTSLLNRAAEQKSGPEQKGRYHSFTE